MIFMDRAFGEWLAVWMYSTAKYLCNTFDSDADSDTDPDTDPDD
jgi:hypothetical protein